MSTFVIYTQSKSSSGPGVKGTERDVIRALVEATKRDSFTAGYKATDAEAFGLLMARYFEWDSRILAAAAYALEDANFHTECGQIREMHKAIESADDDQPYDDSMRRALFAKLGEVYGPLDRQTRLDRVSVLVGRAVYTMSCKHRSWNPITVAEFRRAMELLDTLK